MESIVLGGGCFWCLDAVYRQVKGVADVVCGYAGGSAQTATYQQVCSGTTGHAEVVQVSYDPAAISLEDILDIFWITHDPTSLNKQGYDVGTQYRSAIFYANNQQKQRITASLEQAQTVWDNKIVTSLEELDAFYAAEDYHQDYFAKNPEQGYCQLIINPKLQKLRQKFATLLA